MTPCRSPWEPDQLRRHLHQQGRRCRTQGSGNTYWGRSLNLMVPPKKKQLYSFIELTRHTGDTLTRGDGWTVSPHAHFSTWKLFFNIIQMELIPTNFWLDGKTGHMNVCGHFVICLSPCRLGPLVPADVVVSAFRSLEA